MKNYASVISRKLFLNMIFTLFVSSLYAQTAVELNVNQVSKLIVDAGQDVSIDVGENTLLGGTPTASGGTGVLSYSWSYGNYLDNSTIANPLAEPPENMMFKLTVMDEKGCMTVDSIKITVIGGTALNDYKGETILMLYPNPNSGEFILSLEKVFSSEIKVSISDANGKLVFNNIYGDINGSFLMNISISELSKGDYILKITGDNLEIAKQIILQ